MLFTLTLSSDSRTTFTTTDYRIFTKVAAFLQDNTLDLTVVDALADAALLLRSEEHQQKLRTVLEQKYAVTNSPVEQLQLLPALRRLGNQELKLSASFSEITPVALAALIASGYDEPLALSTLCGFTRKMNSRPLEPLLMELYNHSVVVAGGRPLSNALNLAPVGTGDDDVWVYGADTAARIETFHAVNEALFRAKGTVVGTKGSAVLVYSLPNHPRNINLILTAATSPAEVVRSINIDACRVFAHVIPHWLNPSTEYYALPQAIAAWESNTITDVPVIDSLRLEKMKRRGFGIAVAYTPPTPQAFEDYLHRSYIHNLLDTPEQITYSMKKLLNVTHVYFSAEQLRANFQSAEIYDLNLEYANDNEKLITANSVFRLRADVSIVPYCENHKERCRVKLVLSEVPLELAQLDSELKRKYNHGLLQKDGVTLYTSMLEKGLPTTGAHMVELRYGGVYSSIGRFAYFPITRVSTLTPMAPPRD